MNAQEPVLIRSDDSVYDDPTDTLPSSGWEHIYLESVSSSIDYQTDRWRDLASGTTPLSGFTIDREEQVGSVTIEKPLTENTFIDYLNLGSRDPPTPIDILMFEGDDYKWLRGCVPTSWNISISEDSIVTESTTFVSTINEEWETEVADFPVSYSNITETPIVYSDISYETRPDYTISGINVSVSNEYQEFKDPDSSLKTEIDTMFFTDRKVTVEPEIVVGSIGEYDQIIDTDTYLRLDLENFETVRFEDVVFPQVEMVNEVGSVRIASVSSEPIQMR